MSKHDDSQHDVIQYVRKRANDHSTERKQEFATPKDEANLASMVKMREVVRTINKKILKLGAIYSEYTDGRKVAGMRHISKYLTD